jgi:hypothetical protein
MWHAWKRREKCIRLWWDSKKETEDRKTEAYKGG